VISEVSIKNINLAERIEFGLGNGLNVFSGETGAGKSLVVSAIAFAFALNSDFARLRKDNDSPCVVSISVALSTKLKKELQEMLDELAIEFDEDELIINRTISSDGKTKNSVNGVKSTQATLVKIGTKLLELSGQNDELMLCEQPVQLELLDRYCSGKLSELKAELALIYKEIKKAAAERDELKSDETERGRQIELYSYQIDEINKAELYENEDDEIQRRVDFLKNAEKIAHIQSEILSLMDGGYETPSLNGQFQKLNQLLSKLASYDNGFEQTTATVNDAYYLLEDVSRAVSELSERLDYSENELNEKIERLQSISSLKRKYGHSIVEILSYKDTCQEKLDSLKNFEQNYAEINNKISELFARYIKIAEKISSIRNEKKGEIENAINEELASLDMKNACFMIKLDKIPINDETDVTTCGLESIDFQIRTNPGTPFAPLSKIASGGEMSRIMLAIKSVLSAYSGTPSIIFDEIDTGIGGFTLNAVGEKLRAIAAAKQVICVTHSPIIASFATHHFLVKKDIINGEKTEISFNKLTENEIESEIARMLGNDSDIGISHARELIEKNKCRLQAAPAKN